MADRKELDGIKCPYKEKGFVVFVGALRFSKLVWQYCPAQDKGQYLKTKKLQMLVCIQCEGCGDADVYCWHWDVGRPGSNKEINEQRHQCWHSHIRSKTSCPNSFSFAYKMCRKLDRIGRTSYIIPTRWQHLSDLAHILQTNKGLGRIQRKMFQQNKIIYQKGYRMFIWVFQSHFEILRREMSEWKIDDIVVTAENYAI